MGPKGHKAKGIAFPGLGPTTHGRDRGLDVGPSIASGYDVNAAHIQYRRMVDGRRFRGTSLPPSRSRKHRGGRS